MASYTTENRLSGPEANLQLKAAEAGAVSAHFRFPAEPVSAHFRFSALTPWKVASLKALPYGHPFYLESFHPRNLIASQRFHLQILSHWKLGLNTLVVRQHKHSVYRNILIFFKKSIFGGKASLIKHEKLFF